MIRLALIAWLALCGVANAQLSGGVGGFPGPGTVHSSGSYVGPGDVVSGATSWYGLRAYNAAYAAATGNIADLVAVTGGAAVCTMKAATDGTADLVGTYCGGTTVPLACAAASGGSCKVTRLYDQISTNHLNQATLSQMPALVISSVPGLAANRPSLQFTSASSQNLFNTGFNPGSQPLSFSAVAQRISGTNGGVISGGNSNRPELRFNNTNAIVFAGGTPATRAAADGVFHGLNGLVNGSSSFVNVDGTSGSTAAVATTAMDAGYRIGVSPFNDYLNGYISEAGAWVGTSFSGTNCSDLNTNQHSYWGF